MAELMVDQVGGDILELVSSGKYNKDEIFGKLEGKHGHAIVSMRLAELQLSGVIVFRKITQKWYERSTNQENG